MPAMSYSSSWIRIQAMWTSLRDHRRPGSRHSRACSWHPVTISANVTGHSGRSTSPHHLPLRLPELKGFCRKIAVTAVFVSCANEANR
jgi:hypothetical protein